MNILQGSKKISEGADGVILVKVKNSCRGYPYMVQNIKGR